MATDWNKLAEQVVELVGGKDNITNVLHCVTRLRFNLRDYGAADQEAIKKVPGVLSVVDAGTQLQVVIGPDVNKAYDAVLALTGLTGGGSVDADDVPAEKVPLTPKGILMAALDGLSGTMATVIPALVACAFFKMLTALLGPEFLGVITTESNLYTLLTFVGDAGFYFFPIYVAYGAAKKFGTSPILALLMGAIFIHPTFVGMATEGTPFTVFGIPCNVQNYANSILPALLSVWMMSYIEKFFNKIFPSSVRGLFAPTLTIMVMLPIALCVLGPAGSFLGNYVVAGIYALQNFAGPLGMAIIAGFYSLLVMTGMHMVFIVSLFQVFAEQGFDAFGGPAVYFCSFASMGVGIGAFLRIKNKQQKALAAEFAVTQIVAGTSEPTLYGICARYKKPFIGMIGGGFIAGLVGGILGVVNTTLIPSSNVFAILGFAGGTPQNFALGVGCCILALVAAVLTFLFGFDKDSEAFDPDDPEQA